MWKIIKEFPIYQVSEYGDIKNTYTGNILVGGFDRDGYRQVTLCYNGKQYNRRVCRLVAQAYIDNPMNLPMVNHKNENKSDDCYTNLEWCTAQYNNNYGTRTQKTQKQVQCIETQEIYDGLRTAERAVGICHSSISNACKYGYLAGGFHWRFLDDNRES